MRRARATVNKNVLFTERAREKSASNQSAFRKRKLLLGVFVRHTEQASDDVGPISVELWVASDALDADFTAKLIDLHPPSLSLALRRKLDGRDLPLPLQAFVGGSGAHRVWRTVPDHDRAFPDRRPVQGRASSQAGHLLLQLPEIRCDPNTGAPEGRGRTRCVERNTVFCDAVRPSRIISPVVPVSSLHFLVRPTTYEPHAT
jgi:hypothetical protein